MVMMIILCYNMIYEKSDKMEKKRIIYLELLRVFAAICVIMIHVAAQNWSKANIYSVDWQMMNIYDSFSRVAVPLFVMISGAIFLNRSISIKTIIKKYILRIAIVLIVWSLIYAFIYSLQNGETLKQFILRFIGGHYHLWYLYMLIGLYLIMPILKKITESKQLTEYFLFLSFVFTSFLPTLIKIPIFNFFSDPFGSFHYHLTLGYSSYFVAGYYLHEYDLNERGRKIIYLLGIIGFLFTIMSTSIMTFSRGSAYNGFYNNFMLGVVLEAVAIFVFCKYLKIDLSTKTLKVINFISKYSLGIYLVHVFVLDRFKLLGLTTLSFTSFFSIPILIISVFIASLIISMILNQIPIIKKYIV